MAACDNNTGLDFWLNVPACELYDWLRALKDQQDEILRAMKKAQKK